MIALCAYRIRKILIPGAFFFLALITASFHSMAAEVFISPPGLRLIRDPSVVIPAEYLYTNHHIKLPAYRDGSGNPQNGWSAKFVETRRFASDQSAWIFYRNSDLKQSVLVENGADGGAFRFWPGGTTIVIEIYKGAALQREHNKMIEIAAMSKTKAEDDTYHKAFYPVNWAYSRFDSGGNPSMTTAKVHECHQCHSIAFHYTGDLVFTRFP
jgi:hypothetical protein